MIQDFQQLYNDIGFFCHYGVFESFGISSCAGGGESGFVCARFHLGNISDGSGRLSDVLKYCANSLHVSWLVSSSF